MTRNLLKNSCIVAQSIFVLTTVMFTLGCDNKEGQTATPTPTPLVASVVSQQNKPVLKPVSTALKLTPAPVNQFDFSSKKDPFKPFIAVKYGTASTKENLARNALPIHSFDISQFKLVGIIVGGKESFAQVIDPNGKGYILKKGMAIGKNDGKVMFINNSGVEILEQFVDDNGRVRKENIKLTLPKKQ